MSGLPGNVGDLLPTANLHRLLTALAERCDRSERALADLAAGSGSSPHTALTVIPVQEVNFLLFIFVFLHAMCRFRSSCACTPLARYAQSVSH